MALTTFLNQNIRALVTIIFAVTFCMGFAAGMIAEAAFTGLAGTVCGYWFGVTRDQRRSTDTNGNGSHA